MINRDITNLGTALKLAVKIQCAGLDPREYDWTARVWTTQNKFVEIPKADAVYDEDDECYLLIVNTMWLSEGTVKLTVKASIPDSDLDYGIRKEIATIDTGIALRRNY